MKRWIGSVGPLVMIFALTSFDLDFRRETEVVIPSSLRVIEPQPVVYPRDSVFGELVTARTPFTGRSFIGFREALAFSESSGDYFTINGYGYMGKYQFGIGTLQLIGIYNAVQFLNSPALQEAAFQANIARNKWILRNYIPRFVGKKIRGVRITESGLLAAAHLAGAGNVKKYLRSGGAEEASDAFGTNITHYLSKFRGYDTSEILPEKNPQIL